MYFASFFCKKLLQLTQLVMDPPVIPKYMQFLLYHGDSTLWIVVFDFYTFLNSKNAYKTTYDSFSTIDYSDLK